MVTGEPFEQHDDPIIPMVDALVAQLRARAEQPDAVLTCADLLSVVGPHSYVMALLVFSLLNLLPGPPGYNFLMALAMFALSVAMLLKRPMSFGPWLGQIRLPIRLMQKLLEALAAIARWGARILAPRWRGLTGPPAMPFIAAIAMLLGIVNMAPVPFMNLIPSMGLAVICMGVLNEDGIGVLAGVALGALGAALTVVATWLLLVLAFAVGEIVEQALDGNGL